ncbi:MAG: hypothetical protein ACI8Z1_001449 [Candidatus Azotimanducaceae bacterium]|jgi:hypothetical protein
MRGATPEWLESEVCTVLSPRQQPFGGPVYHYRLLPPKKEFKTNLKS